MDFPIKKWGSFHSCVKLPEGTIFISLCWWFRHPLEKCLCMLGSSSQLFTSSKTLQQNARKSSNMFQQVSIDMHWLQIYQKSPWFCRYPEKIHLKSMEIPTISSFFIGNPWELGPFQRLPRHRHRLAGLRWRRQPAEGSKHGGIWHLKVVFQGIYPPVI